MEYKRLDAIEYFSIPTDTGEEISTRVAYGDDGHQVC